MLPASALKSMNVLWATPCYNAGVSMNYVTSMFELTHAAIRAGLQSSLTLRAESLVTKGRNGIVKHFLMNEQYTHLFWIDADIQFRPAAALRLLLSDLDVAAGAYPIKTFNWPEGGLPHGMTRETFEAAYSEYPFNLIGLGAEPIAKFLTPDDFVEVAEAPTGFMAIKRHVFTKLIANYPELNYVPDESPDNPEAKYYWLFFDCMLDPDTRRYLSEDYAFCRRWRDIGGKVYVDLHSDLGHHGQHVFRAKLAESVRLREPSMAATDQKSASAVEFPVSAAAPVTAKFE